MKYLNISGNLLTSDISVIGLDDNKGMILNIPDLKEHYYLTKLTLKDLDFNREKVLNSLGINKYYEASEHQNKIVVNILDLIESGCKKIIIDELLMFVDRNVRIAIINVLRKENVQFINITSNVEETLYADYMIVIYDGNVAVEGKTLDVLQEEKLLNRLGYNLPFLVDLSIQLKYYGLVDKIYLNQNELVDKLWN